MSYKKEILKSDFPNGKYDFVRLQNQVKGTFKDFDVEITRQGVAFISPDLITADQDATLDILVGAHTGEPQDILIKDTSNSNRLILQEVIAIASDRPDLAFHVNSIVDYYIYLSSIGVMEAYVYFGNRGKERIVNQIISDVTELGTILQIPELDRTSDQVEKVNLYSVLLVEVTAPNDEFPSGIKAYEYLIGKINGLA